MVPTNSEDGVARAVEEGRKVAQLSDACGLTGRIRHVMIPGMIAEDPDRPVEMKPKLDTLEFWNAVRPELDDQMRGLCTQVTAFHDKGQLTERLRSLTSSGIEGITFVGVPRTMADGEGGGVAPTDALEQFTDIVRHRGVILIPTRDSEVQRFGAKCERGATFAMTQLLYSDAIVDFLRDFAKKSTLRPEILLSFGFVPSMETRMKLIDWLIQDPGNPAVAAEQAFVAELAEMKFEPRKQRLLGLYKRVVDGVGELDFPMSIHLEAPYGYSKPAFETFAALLDYWEPTTR